MHFLLSDYPLALDSAVSNKAGRRGVVHAEKYTPEERKLAVMRGRHKFGPGGRITINRTFCGIAKPIRSTFDASAVTCDKCREKLVDKAIKQLGGGDGA